MSINSNPTGFTIPKIYANVPTFYTDQPSDSDPGYVVSGRRALKREDVKLGPLPDGQLDYARMTPDQRALFNDWFTRNWRTPAPDPAFYVQVIHAVEADMTLSPRPSPENIPLLVYLLNHYSPALAKRRQLYRVVSLLRWAAVGSTPGESLRITRLVTQPSQINADLSALYKHNYPLQARAAHYLCLMLEYLHADVIPAEHHPSVKEAFVSLFNARWPNGIVLQKPKVSIPIIHQPGHPDTAMEVAKDANKYAREGWDFLSEPQQFDALLALWREWKAMPNLHVTATLTDPGLRQLAAVPPAQLAETVQSKIHGAAFSFFKSDEIAATLDHDENPKLTFKVIPDPNGLSFSEDEISASFNFVIAEQSRGDTPNPRPVTGSSVAIFSGAGEVYFEDTYINNFGYYLGVEDENEE